MFVRITIDQADQQVILTTTTLISGEKTETYSFPEINTITGEKPASFRGGKGTQYLQIYREQKKLITIERIYVGEDVYDGIVKELERIKT